MVRWPWNSCRRPQILPVAYVNGPLMKYDTAKIGSVMAERMLNRRDSPRRSAVVSIGKPRKGKGSLDWECPFEIRGAGLHVLERGYGIDAFQALTMALEGIRYFIDRSRVPLVWKGVIDDHSGFQRVIPLLPEPGGTRRLERVVERELHVRLKERKRQHALVGHRSAKITSSSPPVADRRRFSAKRAPR